MAEKIFKREDGSRIKVIVELPRFSGATAWNVLLQICDPGKRKFYSIINTNGWKFRSLSTKEREEYAKQEILKLVTKEEIDEVKKLAIDEIYSLEYRYNY